MATKTTYHCDKCDTQVKDNWNTDILLSRIASDAHVGFYWLDHKHKKQTVQALCQKCKVSLLKAAIAKVEEKEN